MAEKRATFAVELEDDVSKGADSAADALSKLKKKIEEDQAALRSMQAAQGRMKGSSEELADVKKKLSDRINATKDSLAKAQGQFIQAGGSLDEIGKKAVNLDTVKGSAGGAAGGASKFASAMGVALGAAIAFVAIVAAGALKLAQFGLGLADNARSARLLASAWAGSTQAGDAVLGQVSRLAAKLPIAKGAINAMATAMMQAGLQGKQLELALEAGATAAAVLGDSAGAKIQGLAEKAKRMRVFMGQALDFQGTGVSLDDVASSLAKNLNRSFADAKAAIQSGGVKVEDGLRAMNDAVQAKFGKIAGQQLLSFPAQIEKLKEDIAGLFSGVDVEPFLTAFREVREVFSSNTVAGRALQGILTRSFKALGEAAIAVAPIIVGFFKGLVIGALYVELGVIKLMTAYTKAFGPITVSKADALNKAIAIGKMVVIGFALAFALAVGPILLMGKALMKVQSMVTAAVNYIRAIDMASVGRNLIRGLTMGILGGEPEVQKAMKGVASRVSATAKASFEQKSPSKLFERIGVNNMAGLAGGHEQGEDLVQASLTHALELPSKVAPPARGAAIGASSTSGAVFHLHFGSAPSRQDLDDPSYYARLVHMLEEAAAMAGLLPEGA